MTDVPAVTHHAAASQFEIHTGAGNALLRYRIDGASLDLLHTEVPASLEGGGYGAALVRAALDYARLNSLTVIPTCSFVRAYMKRHHEYDDLLAAPR
ncbi:GNAT family N-acetyltransferase [soil metagenome]